MFSADELVSVHEWLAEAGLRGEAPERVFASFCEKLAAGGLPIRRAHIAIATLNTSVRAYSLTWTKGEIARTAFRHGRIPTEEWKASPFLHMLNSREQVLRRRLAGQGAVLDFPVLREFAAAGLTDWLGVLVSFHWSADLVEGGRIGMITSWATDDPLGFSDSEIAGIQRLLPSFAAVIKTATVTDIAH